MSDSGPLLAKLAEPLVIGYQLNWALYGALTVQVYIFYVSSVPSHSAVKVMVYILYIVETVQVCVASSDAYHLLGTCDPQNFAKSFLTWLTVAILTGITSTTVQCFYAWRIAFLSRSRSLGGAIVLMSLMQGSAAFATAVQVLIAEDTSNVQGATPKTVIVWLAGSVICDVTITVCMVYLLFRSRTGYRSTDLLLNRLIKLIVETGLCTATLSVLVLTLFLVFDGTLYYVTPALTISKLYSNSLLVLLNSRVRFATASSVCEQSEHTDVWRSDQLARFRSGNNTRSNREVEIQVGIQMESFKEGVAVVSHTNKFLEESADSKTDSDMKRHGSTISTGSV